MAVDAGWTKLGSYGRVGEQWKNNLTGETLVLPRGSASPAPLSQPAIDKYFAVDKLTKNIVAQGSMDHWSTGRGLSKEAAAQMMAEKLYDNGITRLEDLGKIPVMATVPVTSKDYYTYTDLDSGQTYTVEAFRARLMRGADGKIYTVETDWDGNNIQGALAPAGIAANFTTKKGYYVDDGEGGSAFIPINAAQEAQVKDGKLTFDTGQTGYGNKKTGQVIPVSYSRAGTNDFGGTFAGDSSTGFGVQFNAMGMPMFYAHYDTDNSSWGPASLLLAAASIIPSPIQPFAMAANAALQAYQGNTIGAVLSALGSAGGFIGNGVEAVNGMDLASDIATKGYNPAAVLSNIQTAQQAVNVLNSVSQQNFAGLIGSLANLSPQIGVTIPEDFIKPVQLAAVGSAMSKGDWAGAATAAGTLTKNSDVKLAGQALNLVNAVQKGDMTGMATSFVNFAKQADLGNSTIKNTLNSAGFNVNDQQVNNIVQASSPAQGIQAAIDENDKLAAAEAKKVAENASPLSTVTTPSPVVLPAASLPAATETGALNTDATSSIPIISWSSLPAAAAPDTGALPSDSSNIASNAVSTEATTSALPGINVAAADTGPVTDAGSGLGTIEVSGYPIFADSKNADKVRPPFGYDLMPMSLSDSRPEGAYYDMTQNAWFMPNQDAQNLNDALVNSEPAGGLPATDTTQPADNTLYENNGTPSTTVEVPPTTPAVTEPTGALPATTETQPTTPAGGLPATNATTTSGGNTYYENNGTPSTDNTAPVDETPEIVVKANKDDYSGLPGDIANQDTGTGTGTGTETITPTPAPVTTPTPVPAPTPAPAPVTTPTTPATTTSPTPAASSKNPFEIFKLDSSPQFLKSEMPKASPSILLGLHQLFNSLDPEMKSVLADRGITPPGHTMEDTENAATGGLIRAASGGLISEEAQKTLDSLMPKFSKSPTHLAAAPVVQQDSRLSPLKYLRQGLTAGRGAGGGLAQGGLPQKYAKAAPEGHEAEFITGLTGYYAQGGGTGQSDDIPAMLHDGDYVMDADTVAALGDGSSKAGAEVLEKMRKQIPHHDGAAGSPVPAKIADGEYVFPAAFVTAIGGGSNKVGSQRLDEMRQKIRAHKRSAPTSKIPPKAKSPLDYLKMAKG